MVERIHPWEIKLYQTASGRTPYLIWFESLEMTTQAVIAARLSRVKHGRFGDHKPVGEGVYELRVHHGSGYRIYFGKDRDVVVLLLCGGDKDSQSRDIAKAQTYWQLYKESSQ